MKYILYSVLFITLFSCNKKQENKPIQKVEKEYIDDPLVYEVINAVLEMPEITEDKPEYMLNTANMFLFDLGMDGEDFYFHVEKYFEKIDTVSIENQIKKSRNSYYKQEYITNYQLIDYDLTSIHTDEELDSLKNSVNNYIPNISLSLPVFNKEKDVAYLSYLYDCGGGLCGYYQSFFIKKMDEDWKIISGHNMMIF